MISLRRMMISVTLIPTTAVIVIWLSVILFGAYLLRNTIIRQQNLLIDAVSRQCDQYLSETGNMLNVVAHGISDLPPEYQQRFLKRVGANYPRFTTLYLLNPEGRVMIEASDQISLRGLDFSRERFFEPAAQSRSPYFSVPFISLSTNDIAVTGVIPIFVEERLQAMLVGELDLRILQQTIEDFDVGEQGESFIVDPQGTLVAHPVAAWVREQRNVGNLSLFQKAGTEQATFEIFHDTERDRWLVGSAREITWQWVVIVTQPLTVATRPLILLVAITILALGGSIGLFAWTQFSSARRITGPIVHLTRDADILAQGKLPIVQPRQEGTFYEIVSLHQSFTRMAEAILDRTTALQDSNKALNALNVELETRVQQRTSALEIANKELSGFAYVVSHDLKAPLRAISRLAQWLVSDYADAFDDDGKQMIELLVGRVKRMDSLIEGILEYSRIGRLEGEPIAVDLNQVVRDVLDSLAPPEHIQVEVAHELPTLTIDKIRIMQVFQNLISNAIKFLDNPRGEITIDCTSDDAFWIFSVGDNGPGIDPKYHDRIFRIFQTLQPRDTFESTGIGLSLVKKIIEWYGGRVWVESAIGQGSVFRFSLPKAPAGSARQSSRPE